MTDDLEMPAFPDTEATLLGAILINPAAYWDVADYIAAADFSRVIHRWTWEAIAFLADDRQSVDVVTVGNELDRRGRLDDIGGMAALSALMNDVPSPLYAADYARDIEAAAVRRRLIGAASQIATAAYNKTIPVDDLLDRSERVVFDVAEGRRTGDLAPLADAVTAFDGRMTRIQDDGIGAVIGPPTGLRDLDAMLDGLLAPSNLTLLAGRPGMGKTAILLQIAAHVAMLKDNVTPGPVAVFSLEMSADQLVSRLIAARGNLDGERVQRGRLDEDEYQRYVNASAAVHAMPVYLDCTSGLTPVQLRSRCRRLYAEHGGLRLVVVDYIQLMMSDQRRENANQEVAYISRSLKALAKELNCCVLAASQLSRSPDSRADKTPVLSDLRDSGGLEQDADVVMFLFRPGYYRDCPIGREKVLELEVAKNRHGRTGRVEMYWNAPTTTALPLEKVRP